MRKSDEGLKRDVQAELSWDPRVNEAQIGVTVDRGAVSLFGTVETYDQKWAAEAAVRRVRGVRAFAEELSVKLKTPHERTDLELATALGNVLTCSTAVPNTVLAKVEQGWVTLYGEVRHQFQREAALALTTQVQGVLGVTNQIVVVRGQAATATEAGVRAALVRRFGREAESIAVSEEGPRVTLRGSAPTLRAAREARAAAWSAPGVLDVVDAIETGAST